MRSADDAANSSETAKNLQIRDTQNAQRVLGGDSESIRLTL